MKAVAVLLGTLIFSLAGCDDKKSGAPVPTASASSAVKEKASTSAVASTEKPLAVEAPPLDKPAETAAPPPAVSMAASSTGMTATNEAELLAFADKMAAVFIDNQNDCDKMAVAAKKFFADNADMIKRLAGYEKTMTADQKQAFAAKNAVKQKELQEKMMPVMKKCATNKNVEAAMKSMAESMH